MHANVQTRFNPATGEKALYYRLKESYRDVAGHVHSLILLNIGFDPSLTALQVRRIALALTERFKNRGTNSLFCKHLEGLTELEQAKADEWWQRMKEEGGIDRFDKKEQKARKESERYIDLATAEHTDARNVGAEWLCKQTIDKLGLEELLRDQGWSNHSIHTALSALIIRTVYAVSERSSYYYLRDNSAAAELYTGSQDWTPGINALYKVTDKLYELKEKIECHLCNVTDNLFNIDNKLMLFDLTNFYFEGSKRESKKAQFGRSKEKRSDCKLLVLALCINKEGFIRYSSILEGNTADPKSLPDMIDTLADKNPVQKEKSLIVMDAGIATGENLNLIKAKGYNYLCVSRTKLKDYTLSEDHKSVMVKDARKQTITLNKVHTEGEDYYLEITSPSRAMTESSMNKLWRERFETELKKINDGIAKKGGTKLYEKVVERTGRAIQKYPSIARYYAINYIRNEEKPKEMLRVDWKLKDLSAIESGHGVYFLRTNVETLDERTTWDYYNLIREIECTNRQLKTDLNLRPIYHQTDNRSDAHLFFGLLAYWVVNTIRCQLKREGESCYWTEIVRRMSTQKLVTTEGRNPLGDIVQMRQCSNPSKQATAIYDKLKLKYAPFRKIKICRTQSP
ncbi:transposase, IS4 family [Prevotella disiens FB035-09AN]|uniref:Transposase, IS4 family n=1 Tax=Prevotella disiens FB035-09AN TaxID=866771 RepID=E1KQ82_9BACT|nr:IS1634 family transposase [Prevotella disiens]EFL46411.1 transposase, IS4 family [Prevotella disiens FB035-09AN]